LIDRTQVNFGPIRRERNATTFQTKTENAVTRLTSADVSRAGLGTSTAVSSITGTVFFHAPGNVAGNPDRFGEIPSHRSPSSTETERD